MITSCWGAAKHKYDNHDLRGLMFEDGSELKASIEVSYSLFRTSCMYFMTLWTYVEVAQGFD